MSFPCTHCVTPDRLGEEELDSFYSAGEVFSVRESVFTPIEDLFSSRAISSLAVNERHRSQASLASLRTRHEATLKSRPCILLQDFENPQLDRRRAWICLMATFEGTPMADLPRVFHYFCHPVYPNAPEGCDNAHFHSLPEWADSSCWIIAWAIQTTRALETRWFTEDEWNNLKKRHGGYEVMDAATDNEEEGARRIGVAFGLQATQQLKDRCQALRKSWQRRCQRDKAFAREYEREYRDYREKRNAQSSPSVPCNTVSISPSRMMPSSSAIPTIFEEQTNTESRRRSVAVSAVTVDGWSTISKTQKGNSVHIPHAVHARAHQSADKPGASSHVPGGSHVVQKSNKRTSRQSAASTIASRTGPIRGGQNTLARFANHFSALRKKSIGDA